eukprot:5585518-Pyramimonas_sp.AAC.1
MKVNAIIAVQEVHGSEDALRIFLQSQPQKYLSFLSPGPSAAVGGVAFLVPRYVDESPRADGPRAESL